MPDDDIVIEQTKLWINKVVVGCNFCPFAAKEMKRESVSYTVVHSGKNNDCLHSLARIFEKLNEERGTETSFLVFPESFDDFYRFLDILALGEELLEELEYEGIYQLASFHPLYLFAGAKSTDPANYTNRSPYPMIQVLREESITHALESFENPDRIPEKNIEYASQKGLAHMQALRDSCLTIPGEN